MSVPTCVSASRPGPSRRAVFAMAGVLALTLSACATAENAPSSTAGDGAVDSVVLATGFAVESLDPYKAGYWGNELGWGELLMRPVTGKEPEPWLLQDVKNTDDLTWVLTLKDKTRFQNGSPLDGKALAAVMNHQLKNNESLAELKKAQISATGDREVTVKTATPVPHMTYLLADESKFLVFDLPTYLKHKEKPAELVGAKIYTGPYVVDKLDNQGISMKADPNYWGGQLPLKTVGVKFLSDAEARILAVKSGEVDIALYPPTNQAKTIEGSNEAFWSKGTPKGPTFQFQMNQKTGPLTDVNVRKAVLSSIDYDEIAQDVMGGLYEVTQGMYHPSAPYYEQMFGTDTTAAEKLLTAAGYAKDADGRFAKDGQPLTLNVLTYPQQPDSGTLALAVQSQLAKAGITVTIQQVPDTNAAKQDGKTKWDATVEGNGTTSFSGDPISPLQTQFTTQGNRNLSGLGDPELDAMIEKVATTMNTGEREQLLRGTQKHIGEKAYMGFLGMRVPGVVVGPRWKNYTVPPANLWVGYDTRP